MVSVLMTSFNREKFIKESIESVLSQTYTDFELIIVDDNSIDRTQEIILSYKEHRNIRFYFNSHNLGEYQNRNKAASYAKGKYLKYLDSDDLMSNDCLEVMVNQMEKYPNAGIGLISYFDHNLPTLKNYLSSEELYKEFYFKGNLINCGPSSTIIKREAFNYINGYKLEPYLSDTDFIFRISSLFGAVVFSSRLVTWRQHVEQEYHYGIQSGEYKNKSFAYFKKYLDELSNPLSKKDSEMALRNLKNRYSRNILLNILTLKFMSAAAEMNLYSLSSLDLFLSLIPNQYPKN